jgi:protein-S-isoprenylcysteine O-methyltransferase Ste14
MDLGGLGWGLQTIIGGFLLFAVLLWAMLRNRKSTPEEVDRTERATRDLYREEDAAHRKDDTLGT